MEHLERVGDKNNCQIPDPYTHVPTGSNFGVRSARFTYMYNVTKNDPSFD